MEMGDVDDVDLNETLELDFGEDESDDVVNLEPGVYLTMKSNSIFSENKVGLQWGQNRVGRNPKTCKVLLKSGALSKEHAIIDVKKNAAFVWDVGSRNRTRRNDAVLQPEMRYEVLHGDRLRFADLECVFERKEEDILVPDSQGLHRKSANFSLVTEDSSTVDSLVNLRSSIETIVQDSLLGDSVLAHSGTAGDDVDTPESQYGRGLFTQTYSPIPHGEANPKSKSPFDTDSDDDDDELLLSSQNSVGLLKKPVSQDEPTQCFTAAELKSVDRFTEDENTLGYSRPAYQEPTQVFAIIKEAPLIRLKQKLSIQNEATQRLTLEDPTQHFGYSNQPRHYPLDGETESTQSLYVKDPLETTQMFDDLIETSGNERRKVKFQNLKENKTQVWTLPSVPKALNESASTDDDDSTQVADVSFKLPFISPSVPKRPSILKTVTRGTAVEKTQQFDQDSKIQSIEKETELETQIMNERKRLTENEETQCIFTETSLRGGDAIGATESETQVISGSEKITAGNEETQCINTDIELRGRDAIGTIDSESETQVISGIEKIIAGNEETQCISTDAESRGRDAIGTTESEPETQFIEGSAKRIAGSEETQCISTDAESDFKETQVLGTSDNDIETQTFTKIVVQKLHLKTQTFVDNEDMEATELIKGVPVMVPQSPPPNEIRGDDEFYDSFESLPIGTPKKIKPHSDDPESQYFECDGATPSKRSKTDSKNKTSRPLKKSLRASPLTKSSDKYKETQMLDAKVTLVEEAEQRSAMQTCSPNRKSKSLSKSLRASLKGKENQAVDSVLDSDSIVDVFDLRELSDSPSSTSQSSTSQSSILAEPLKDDPASFDSLALNEKITFESLEDTAKVFTKTGVRDDQLENSRTILNDETQAYEGSVVKGVKIDEMPVTEALPKPEKKKKELNRVKKTKGKKQKGIEFADLEAEIRAEIEAETDASLPSKQQRTPPPPKEQRTPPPSKEQHTFPPSKEQRTPPPTKEQRTSPPSKEQRTPPPLKERRTSPPSKEQRTSPPSKEQRTSPPSKEQRTPPPLKEQRTPPPPKEQRTPPQSTSNLSDRFDNNPEPLENNAAVKDRVIPDQWNCPICTFLNHGAIQECEMCESPRVYKKTRKSEILPNSPMRKFSLGSPRSEKTAANPPLITRVEAEVVTKGKGPTTKIRKDENLPGVEVLSKILPEVEEKPRGTSGRKMKPTWKIEEAAENETNKRASQRRVKEEPEKMTEDGELGVLDDPKPGPSQRGKRQKMKDTIIVDENSAAASNLTVPTNLKKKPGKRSKKEAPTEDLDAEDAETSSVTSNASSGSTLGSEGSLRRSRRRTSTVVDDQPTIVSKAEEPLMAEEGQTKRVTGKGKKSKSRQTPMPSDIPEEIEKEVPAKRKRQARASEKK